MVSIFNQFKISYLIASICRNLQFFIFIFYFLYSCIWVLYVCLFVFFFFLLKIGIAMSVLELGFS